MVTETTAPRQAELCLGVGSVVGAKYEVEAVLGTGGMGTVVAARHLEMGHTVALKFLLPSRNGQSKALERFAREATAAAAIKSDHVVRVYDNGQLDDGSPYLVMEHLAGRSLDARLAAEGALPVQEAVGLFIQACAGLAAAHAAGIVHRDIKPGNLFVCEREDGGALLKLLDFGVSKSDMAAEAPTTLTTSNDFLGSPSYMPPEQFVSARSVDARSDIWALGAALWKTLTGKLPYAGETIGELCAAIMNREPPRLLDVQPELPRGLSDVVAKAMARQPEDRFGSAGAFAQALLPYAPPDVAPQVERIVAFEATHPPTVERPAAPADVQPSVTGAGSLAATVAAKGAPVAAVADTQPAVAGDDEVPAPRTMDFVLPSAAFVVPPAERRWLSVKTAALATVGLSLIIAVASFVVHKHAGTSEATAPKAISQPAGAQQRKALGATLPPSSATQPAAARKTLPYNGKSKRRAPEDVPAFELK